MIETYQAGVNRNRQEWLKLRGVDVTSTQIAALFNLSPYQTPYELAMTKMGKYDPPYVSNERTAWGNRLESVIAQAAAETNGWRFHPDLNWSELVAGDDGLGSQHALDGFEKLGRTGADAHVIKNDVYCRDPDLRLGASFDFMVLHERTGEIGILEIKNVDSRVFASDWRGPDGIEPPPHILLQAHVQMMLSGTTSGYIAALVGGNDLHVLPVFLDPGIEKGIRSKVSQFWELTDAGIAPDWTEKDCDIVMKCGLSNVSDDKTIEADEKVEELMERLHAVQDEIKALTTREKLLKAKLIERAGDATKIVGEVYSLACGVVREVPPKVITLDMVGKKTGGRSAFRTCRLTFSKKK